ncbi:MAG TPA: hypothetical protein DEP28_04820 [Bacteroidetes bacterium]|nr:hypothetical protein [Bacteroidota bacterium]
MWLIINVWKFYELKLILVKFNLNVATIILKVDSIFKFFIFSKMVLKIFVSRNISLERCPSCKNFGTLKKSRSRNIFEKFVHVFMFKYYSCKNCGWRSMKFKYIFAKTAFKSLLIYLVIIIITVLLLRFVLTNLFV